MAWWFGEILRWFARPKTVTHPSISRGGRELNPRPSSRESNALTTRLPSHHRDRAVHDLTSHLRHTSLAKIDFDAAQLRQVCVSVCLPPHGHTTAQTRM